jgi:hypothetical protein
MYNIIVNVMQDLNFRIHVIFFKSEAPIFYTRGSAYLGHTHGVLRTLDDVQRFSPKYTNPGVGDPVAFHNYSTAVCSYAV